MGRGGTQRGRTGPASRQPCGLLRFARRRTCLLRFARRRTCRSRQPCGPASGPDRPARTAARAGEACGGGVGHDCGELPAGGRPHDAAGARTGLPPGPAQARDGGGRGTHVGALLQARCRRWRRSLVGPARDGRRGQGADDGHHPRCARCRPGRPRRRGRAGLLRPAGSESPNRPGRCRSERGGQECRDAHADCGRGHCRTRPPCGLGGGSAACCGRGQFYAA